jgi:Ser/Thr protein kinase RdoA (MazF antagonist)
VPDKNLGSDLRPVVLRGATVRRRMHPWSAAVHGLLRHLESVGFPAPRLLDVDGDEEILTYLPGSSGADGWACVVSEPGLRAFAEFLRRYHDSVHDFRPDTPFVTGVAQGPGEIVCHGDFGPWNVVFRDQRPIGLLDFDYARPGPHLWDVAYAIEYVVPFRDDHQCITDMRHPVTPDRLRRMRVFADAYGIDADPFFLATAVSRVQHDDLSLVRALAERGLQPQATWVRDGYLNELRKRIAWTEAFAATLRPTHSLPPNG